jgi:excisionase family DNA binding protein
MAERSANQVLGARNGSRRRDRTSISGERTGQVPAASTAPETIDYMAGGRPTSSVAQLLKPADVARRLGVSRSWLYDAAKAGRLPHVRLGGPEGPVRFIEADLLAWLAEARAAWRPGRGAGARAPEDAAA